MAFCNLFRAAQTQFEPKHCKAASSIRRPSALVKIDSVLVRRDHVARFIVNPNHSIMWKRE
jgi:hypothetical protein